MKVAVEGCAHGDLDNIYATLQHLERVENTKIDLLICCGDFQAVRNEDDLECLACPVKYRSLNTFWKYYSGQERAPYPTVFVGGNHEASNYLWELYYGGWVAPEIYFLGFSGVINFGGIRIGGLSGIFKPRDYRSGHYERAPYNSSDIRSIYHVREYDVQKLMQVKEKLDIFISHDWPRGIAKYGNTQELLRHKPFLQKEIEENSLGSKPGEQLLQKLKPLFWFSAHLHTKFAALVQHQEDSGMTKFLALDKCLPNRNFLQVIELPSTGATHEFKYDEEWLAITRAYHPYFPLTRAPAQLPVHHPDLQSHQEWVKKRLLDGDSFKPSPFSISAPPYDPVCRRQSRAVSSTSGQLRNSQTDAFLELLELPYVLDGPGEPPSTPKNPSTKTLGDGGADPDEIVLDDEEEESGSLLDDVDEFEATANINTGDGNEIALDDLPQDDDET